MGLNTFPPFEKGNKYGKGRPKGSRNKKTIERTEKERQVLEDTSALTRLAYYIIGGIDDGSLKRSEAIKAYDVFAKFFIKTTAQDQDDEVIESLDRTAAEQIANQIQQRIAKMTPKTLEEEE